ncbi:hypothetical protein Agub_g8812 [Astrephomene gubernaculifera]|uniref:Uncharacterized protein n=1 Tax=Astrephomene gubernaculifera TaxID=47775 RepID=A0AAD3DS99_9CHLO|nr:hypothetical protein Agub_g8812 [Astrephomene gubernaculifera]
MGSGASTQVQPKYKWEQDHVLRGPWTFLFKEKVQCACEGSKWCTRENPARQKQPNAIPGLHSSWVGEHVLAMARPWQAHVTQYDMVAAFQQARIGMILNLQETGEHAHCGPGNLPHTGFTYDPESFMAGGVGYYNFAWRDMGVPNLDRMMDIVQVMDYVTRVEGRKVAVHCHAGLGRTGLSIACFFVFSGMYDSAEEAIQVVRQHRPGAVQTSKQVAFVSIFGQYLRHLRCLFPSSRGTTADGELSRHTSGGLGGGGDPSSRNNSGGKASGDGTAKSPSPSTAGSPVFALPTEGLLEQKSTATALVGTYSTGLTISIPLIQPTQSSPLPAAAAGGDATAAAAAVAASGDPSCNGGGALTDSDLGLQTPLPWNDTFHIQPQHARDFRPRPPRSYSEALARQARLLHGPERRAHLRLHKLVTEAVFAIMAAAQSFQPPAQPKAFIKVASSNLAADGPAAASAPAARTSASALPSIPENLVAAGLAGSGGGAVQLPPTFAHAMALLIRSHGPAHVESAALEPLASDPVYTPLTGPLVHSRDVLAAVSGLREELNCGRYEGLARAPLLAVLMLLEGFFANFAGGAEPSSLTEECLTIVAKSYQDLFDSHVPAPPGSRRASAAGEDGISGGGGGGNSSSSVAPGGSDASLELARQAYDTLEPLQPRDSELLLLFASMMRVVARVSGPGCEEAMVEVGKWAVGLLLGKLASMPEAQEAVLSFLWYLAGRDEAFAMLVLLKRQRMTGILRKGGARRGAADVAAMLQAAAVSLTSAAPPGADGCDPSDGCVAVGLPGELPRSPGATPPPGLISAFSSSTAPDHALPAWAVASLPPSSRASAVSSVCSAAAGTTPVAAYGESYSGKEGAAGGLYPSSVAAVPTLASPPSFRKDPNGLPVHRTASSSSTGGLMDPKDVQGGLLPVAAAQQQFAQLLAQDIPAMYRVSYREALAGISSVVYPPPPSTGRVEVHDVWR